MYQKREKQVSLYENSICFATGAPLDPQNRWVKLSGMIPWDQIEEKYSLTFDNPIKGKPAKSCRMVIGSLIIKEMRRFSDDDTAAMITENPYLQFFIGLSAFINKGTLIVDATCAPADIHFPTDVSLLSEGREKLEGMIDTLHDAKRGPKPRTYREKARKQYLQLVRNRKPRYRQIRKAIR